MSTIQQYIEQNDQWVLVGDFNCDMLQEPISKIHLCAIQSAPFCPPGVPLTNDWSACFEVAGSGSSIRMDPSPGGDLGLRIILEEIPPSHIEYPAHVVSIGVPGETALETLLNVVIKNNRDHYRFTDSGEGSRHWLTVLLNDLRSEKLVSSEDAQVASCDLALFWKSFPVNESSPSPVVQGTFTQRST